MDATNQNSTSALAAGDFAGGPSDLAAVPSAAHGLGVSPDDIIHLPSLEVRVAFGGLPMGRGTVAGSPEGPLGTGASTLASPAKASRMSLGRKWRRLGAAETPASSFLPAPRSKASFGMTTTPGACGAGGVASVWHAMPRVAGLATGSAASKPTCMSIRSDDCICNNIGDDELLSQHCHGSLTPCWLA